MLARSLTRGPPQHYTTVTSARVRVLLRIGLLLQKLADIWAYPDFINAAAAAQDPLERMKLLVAWMVAGGHMRQAALLTSTIT
jgi:hypothetical protein